MKMQGCVDGLDFGGEPDPLLDDTVFPSIPRPWDAMSDEEKGALLLAHHEGKVIECFDDGEWFSISEPSFVPHAAYRVRPEPKREAVTCYWNGYNIHRANNKDRTHRITFELVDGEPDCDTIKMEKIT